MDSGSHDRSSWIGVIRVLDGVAAAMEREWFLYLFLIADLYVLITAASVHRPFWFDELFTLYMVRLPSMSAVWAALKDGVDLNPPLFYVVTRFFQSLFGASEWVIRMPAMIGFLVMMFGLYRFVSRYGSRPAGMVAMTFPLATGAYYYAQEARAYGMELGFVAIAAVCWQAAARTERRRLTLPGLSLCLGCALLTHCYAVLAVIPFGFAEASRTLGRKKVDWPMWVAMGIPCLAVLTYLPLMHAVTGDDPLDNPVYHATVRDSYEMMLAPAFWPLIAALAAVALLGSRIQEPDKRAIAIPFHEMILAGGFVVAPFLGAALASTVTKIFMDRYGLAAILGVSIAVGTLVAVRTTQHRGTAVLVIAIFVGGFLWAPAQSIVNAYSSKAPPAKQIRLADLDPALPIVVANELLFLEYDHYEPREVADRLFFLSDNETALRYTGTIGAQFRQLRKWFPIRSQLEDYRAFLGGHPNFYILSVYDFPMDWTMQKMRDDGVTLTFVNQFPSRHGNVILAKVSRASIADSGPARNNTKEK